MQGLKLPKTHMQSNRSKCSLQRSNHKLIFSNTHSVEENTSRSVDLPLIYQNIKRKDGVSLQTPIEHYVVVPTSYAQTAYFFLALCTHVWH